MPLASIDIGTNSVLLLVAEHGEAGILYPIEEQCAITRLGAGVDALRRLRADAIARTLEAVERFALRARALGASSIEIVGTSALRDARNGALFLERVRGAVGLEVSIISGRREAELVLAGVQTSFGQLDGGAVVFDVGGGSTELIVVDDRGGVADLCSLDIGSVRLKERHVAHDPATAQEVHAVEATIRAALATLPGALGAGAIPPPLLVGVSGTVTTLFAIEAQMAHYEASKVDGGSLSREQVAALCRRLAALPLTERRQVVGLEPKRADVIVAGALIVAEVMRFYRSAELKVADRGVRWGLLASAERVTRR